MSVTMTMQKPPPFHIAFLTPAICDTPDADTLMFNQASPLTLKQPIDNSNVAGNIANIIITAIAATSPSKVTINLKSKLPSLLLMQLGGTWLEVAVSLLRIHPLAILANSGT